MGDTLLLGQMSLDKLLLALMVVVMMVMVMALMVVVMILASEEGSDVMVYGILSFQLRRISGWECS